MIVVKMAAAIEGDGCVNMMKNYGRAPTSSIRFSRVKSRFESSNVNQKSKKLSVREKLTDRNAVKSDPGACPKLIRHWTCTSETFSKRKGKRQYDVLRSPVPTY